MMSGIYYFKNLTNGKFYIGQSVNIKKRINQHRNQLINGAHTNKYLQEDWNLGHKFTVGILTNGPIELIKQIETNLIILQANNPNCYNISTNPTKNRPKCPKKPIEEILREKDKVRFFKKTKRLKTCLIWEGCVDNNGYPKFSLSGQNILAHHVAWSIKYQERPKNYIKHTCGNTLCVNADHLVDCGNEGRKPEISFVDILAKKKSGLSTTQIADELGCDPTTVRRRLRKGY